GRVAADRPGGVAGKKVNLAGLQRGEAILGTQRGELDLGAVTEDGRRDGAAIVDVEARPFAFVVRRSEAGQTGGDAALHETLRLDVVERRRRGGRRGDDGCCDAEHTYD